MIRNPVSGVSAQSHDDDVVADHHAARDVAEVTTWEAATLRTPDSDIPLYGFPEPQVNVEGFGTTVTELVDYIVTRREADRTPASSRWELGLRGRTRMVIDEWRADGRLKRLARHLDDDTVMSELRLWTALRASLLWPLSPLLHLPDVEEITILRRDRMLLTLNGERLLMAGPPDWGDEQRVQTFFERIVTYGGVMGDRTISESRPAAEFSFAGFRFCLLRDPILAGTSSVGGSIRVPARARLRTLDDLVRIGTVTAGCARFLDACVRGGVNLLVSGGTGSGKTTLLRILCRSIARTKSVVTVEDSPELDLEGDRGDGRPWVAFTQALTTVPDPTREEPLISMKYLVRRAMRVRPNIIIVGETRGVEAADMVRAMTSGHDGCMTTVHADDSRGAIETFVFFVCEQGDFNESMAERRIRRGIEVVVQVGESTEGARQVVEVVQIGRTAANDQVLYSRGDTGALVCVEPRLAQLDDRLQRKLRTGLPDGRLPP